MSEMQPFAVSILAWYKSHARSLPWRGHIDPYAVWVSEIMLQQTRVDTVVPYFTRWMEHFPTLEVLAASDEQDVLALWEGLGYYSRARTLLKAARMVLEEFGGKVPRERKTLETLPGVGRYTAAAIASIAFGQDEPVLDGNVKRVLARVTNFLHPVNTPAGEKELWRLAEEMLPEGQAGEYNQAVMDFGATLCTPRNPDCGNCPVQKICLSYRLGVQLERPVMVEKAPVPTIQVAAAVIHRGGTVLIARRPSRGLLGGLWEFPGGKMENGETLPQALKREIQEELRATIEVEKQMGEYRHAYTHFKVQLTAFYASLEGSEPVPLEASEIRWVEIQELKNFPMGKIDRKISQDLEKRDGTFH